MKDRKKLLQNYKLAQKGMLILRRAFHGIPKLGKYGFSCSGRNGN